MSGSPRESVGKKDAKKQRAEGKVPCVLYGTGDQIHFAADSVDFKDLIFTPEVCFVDITLGDKTHRAVLQDIQYHPVSDAIYHADFLELIPGKAFTMHVPVQLKGNSKGVIKGGRLMLKLRKLAVKATSDNMPDNIVIDISKLDIGQSIKVRDLAANGFEFQNAPNAMIVAVVTTRVAVDEEEEEEGAEGEGEGEGEKPAAAPEESAS